MDAWRQTILIPALNPGASFEGLLWELAASGFTRIVVVDDGSAEEYRHLFRRAEDMGCVVVRHEKNQGKGAAIKTGLLSAAECFDISAGVITVDADGQHLPRDVQRIAMAMENHPCSLVLGTREFSGDDVPARSRFGNTVTALFFKAVTGVACSDTQTGLRGIPANLFQMAMQTEGSRYEYEMNFLMDAAKVVSIESVPITTVYEDGNSSSHFRPIADSARVYGRFLRFAAASLAGALVDIGLFALLGLVFSFEKAGTIFAATAAARVVSGLANFFINRHFSFKSRMRVGGEAVRYGILFIAQMLASAALVSLLSALPAATVVLKIAVDTVLFFISFRIQNNWVFRQDGGMSPKRNRRKSGRWYPIGFGAVLAAYTAFTLLDAFVIPGDVVAMEDVTEAAAESDAETDSDNSDSADSGSADSDSAGAGKAASEAVITDTSYVSDGVSITISAIREYDTDIYVADIVLSDADSLTAGLAEGSFGRNIKETTSDIAEECGAILAINGDFYGFRDTGYVMRNGYLYRSEASSDSSQQDLVIYEDGSMEVVNEQDVTAEELAAAGAVQIFSFGPGLISDGSITVDESSEVEQAMRSNPRTAIGMIEPLHYVMVVSDGRTDESDGLTLYELANVMEELGCTTAYNLDGGGSSTMWFNGEVINNPTGGRGSGERSVSDIVYIAE